MATNVKKFVCVSFEKEGTHFYKEAGTDPELTEVSYLQYPHRHMFKFVVKISVTDNNRELEFIKVKHRCLKYFADDFIDIDYKSCEMLCEDLYHELAYDYGKDRTYIISCYEDGENGVELIFEPTE